MTWNEATEAMKAASDSGKEPKILLVDIYTDWCSWCKKMQAESFEKPYVAKFVNRYFYPVKFNAESTEVIQFEGQTFRNVPLQGKPGKGVHQLAYSLLNGQMRYPTVVFLNKDFFVLQRVSTYMDDFTLFTVLNYMVSDEYGETTFKEFQEDFKRKHNSLTDAQQEEQAQPAAPSQGQKNNKTVKKVPSTVTSLRGN